MKSRLGTGKPLTFFHSVRRKRHGPYSCCMNVPTKWNVQCICCCTIPADLLLNLKLSSGQHFSVIRRACGALMFLLEPKGRGGGGGGGMQRDAFLGFEKTKVKAIQIKLGPLIYPYV